MEKQTKIFSFTKSIVLLDDLQSVLRNAQTDPKQYWFCECLNWAPCSKHQESTLEEMNGNRGRLVRSTYNVLALIPQLNCVEQPCNVRNSKSGRCSIPELAWVAFGDEGGRGDVTLSSLLESATNTAKSVHVCHRARFECLSNYFEDWLKINISRILFRG